jgi:putative membrane protein
MSPRWHEEGDEPDYRFSLANERTFLAWLRTALGLLGAAVALTQLVPAFSGHLLRAGLATLLAVTGAVLAAMAYRRWAHVQRAMRNGRALPVSRLPVVLGWALTLTGSVVVVVLLTHTH